MRHLCAYELGMCHLFSLDWVSALAANQNLFKENDWSRAFFAYVCAVRTQALPVTQRALSIAHSTGGLPLVFVKGGASGLSLSISPHPNSVVVSSTDDESFIVISWSRCANSSAV